MFKFLTDRLSYQNGLFPLLLATLAIFSFCCENSLNAVYITRFNTIVAGGISFTGNTLGLSKAADLNEPGPRHSIGTFITTDSSQSVGSYPASVVPPAGTILTWEDSSSSAVLDLPPGSTVLYAELIWSGSYGWGGQIPFPGAPFIPDVAIPKLTTPQLNTFNIILDPATSQQVDTPGSTNMGNYVRSADITSIIQAAGAGTYVVSGVPGTDIDSDNSHNAAGWTLAVAYANDDMLTSNLTIFVGCEQGSSSGPPAEISGFCTPSTGILLGQLFVSATEGDYELTGDQLLFGDTPMTLTPVSGINNPINNFFCSQLNTLLPLIVDPGTGKLIPVSSAILDTRGSYGSKNFPISDPFPNNFGRQGYDITSIDVTSLLVPGQTSAYVKGTTTGDEYTINGLGLQIAIGSPVLDAIKFVDNEDLIFATVGDTLTYKITIENKGSVSALNAVFKDFLEAGQTFVSGSFKFNGVTQPDPDLTTGFNMGTITVGSTVDIEFQVTIDSFPIGPPIFENESEITYFFITCLEQVLSGMTISNEVAIIVLPKANPDFGTTPVNTTLYGSSVLDNDIGIGLVVISNTQGIQGGTVVVNPDGTYIYTPPLNFVGDDIFTYTIQDIFGNTASTSVTITVTPLQPPPPPPLNPDPPRAFIGVIKKCKLLNKTQYRLHAHWKPSRSASVVKYRIYHNNKLVETISSSSKKVFTTCLHSHHSARNYEIAAVNNANIESTRIKIRIKHE